MEPKHDYVTLYHGTTLAALEGIKENGFVPNAKDAFVLYHGFSLHTHYCYFTQSLRFAQNIATWRGLCTSRLIPSDAAPWPMPPTTAIFSPPVVLTLKMPQTIFARFEPDPAGSLDGTEWQYPGVLSPTEFVITDVRQLLKADNDTQNDQ